MTIESIITDRIVGLGPEYRSFVESDFIEEAAFNFAASLNLTGRRVEVLENAIIMYFLLIFSSDEAAGFLSRNLDLGPNEATEMWLAIQSTMPEGLVATIESTRQLANDAAPETNNDSLSSEIAETEKALWALPNIRTMADDMQASPNPPTSAAVLPEEQVHSSSQADILPNGNTMPTPRWESDN